MAEAEDNIIDVLGYQLERVHTSIMAWLLDSRASPLSPADRARIVASLFGVRDVERFMEADVRPKPECSFGRTRRIDLVLFIETPREPVERRAVVIEIKVDSDANPDQLRESRRDFKDRYPQWKPSFILLTLGAARATIDRESMVDDPNVGFRALRAEDALNLFGGCRPLRSAPLYTHWLDALRGEIARADDIEQAVARASAEQPEDPEGFLRRLGYRPGSPVFYLLYERLRRYLDGRGLPNWTVYGAGNNPVMNWRDGWTRPARCRDSHGPALYWEFNGSALCLKACLDDAWRANWTAMKKEISAFATRESGAGKRTAFRRGTWVTAHKWEFDFFSQSLERIAGETARIIRAVHPAMEAYVKRLG